MGSENIIDSYLVRLGATIDTASVGRFKTTLADISDLVDNTYLDMAKKFVEFQVGVTSGFAAIGIAALGIADKTAMADQNYRLLALHMYTSLPVARELKVALDALGQPLENVLWDPELAGRFHQLVQDQQKMTENLGPNFEKNMVKLRDLRFEFTRTGVEVQYLTMLVVEDLAEAFGTNIDGITQKLKAFNDYVIQHMPEIAQFITNKLKPVLIEVKDVLAATWDLTKQIGSQLKDIDWVKVIGDIGKAVIGLTQIEGNLVILFSAANAARKGNFAEAYGDLQKMQEITGKTRISVSGVNPLEGAGRGLATSANVQSAIVQQAKSLGVDPSLALAVAQVESGFRQFDTSGKVLTSNAAGSHATGIFQLQPGTAKSLGVDPNDTGQNIAGGVKYLKQLLDKYGDPSTALQHYYGSKNASENQAYAARVMKAEGDITVNVYPAAGSDSKQIGNDVAKAVKDAQDQRVQRNLAELNNMGYSY